MLRPQSLCIFLLTMLFISVPAFCADNIDAVLRKLDLMKLIEKEQAFTIQAQMSDPRSSTKNVNDLTEFVAISVKDNDDSVWTRFDRNQNILKQMHLLPMMGHDQFTIQEIPSIPLQEGLDLVRTCMAEKGETLPENIVSVSIYKALHATSHMVYYYLFRSPTYLHDGMCLGYIYVPASEKGVPGDCQRGMREPCRLEF